MLFVFYSIKYLLAQIIVTSGICLGISAAKIHCDDSHELALKIFLILISITYIIVGVNVIF